MRHYAIAALALVGILASGCAEQDSPVIVLNNGVPGPTCSANPDDGAFYARGTIDTGAPRGYIFTPVLESFASTGPTVDRRQRLVYLAGAEVELTFQEGLFAAGELGEELQRFTVRFSGTVEPDGGRAAVAFPIIPPEVLAALDAKLSPQQATPVRAEVSVFGEMSGADVETPSFTYYLDVCKGCLITDLGSCAELPEGFMSGTMVNGCGIGQDDAVECCTSGLGQRVCPAQSEAMDMETQAVTAVSTAAP